jgi:predicted glycosyl hydrolase (DUF1957 family)
MPSFVPRIPTDTADKLPFLHTKEGSKAKIQMNLESSKKNFQSTPTGVKDYFSEAFASCWNGQSKLTHKENLLFFSIEENCLNIFLNLKYFSPAKTSCKS